MPNRSFSKPGQCRLPADEADRWLDAAARLAGRGVPLSRPNPSVGAIIVRRGVVVGRGWTQPGGRPHAEAAALTSAGELTAGATLYVTLEPCAHRSARGPACADLIAGSDLAHVVIGCSDPDPRTAGAGIARIRASGVTVDLHDNAACQASLAGYLTRTRQGRPHVSLKLAISHDGRLALQPGQGQWLTGSTARAHVHAWRARMDAILVGSGTLQADQPRLDVRLPGLASRSPERWLLTRGIAPAGWQRLPEPAAISNMSGVQYLMVEGGAQTARAFLAAGLIDRLLLYRAPITIGGNGPALPELTAAGLQGSTAWSLVDSRQLGNDNFQDYERQPCSPE